MVDRAKLSVVLVAMLVAEAASGAQTPRERNEILSQSTADAKPADEKLQQWRSLTFSGGFDQYDYREPDPTGRVNILDSETGNIKVTSATLRWSGELLPSLPNLALQASHTYRSGETTYVGFLQQGSGLLPYAAKTKNKIEMSRLRLGLPVSFISAPSLAQPVIMYIEYNKNRWRRGLYQYEEVFRWSAYSFGATALWPLSKIGIPALSGLTVELDASFGRTSGSTLTAPSLNFQSSLNEGISKQIAATIRQHVAIDFLIGLSFEVRRRDLGSSPRVNGLQYPGAHQTSKNWLTNLTIVY